MTVVRYARRRGLAMVATGVACALGGAFLWLVAPHTRVSATESLA